MDDKEFDDIIKRKVGEHEDPVFDSSALSRSISGWQRWITCPGLPVTEQN